MTFAELVEEVLENVSLTPGGEKVQAGEVKRLLNLIMREVSLTIGVPTLYLDVPSTGFVTGAFQMPVTVHPEGIKYAEVVEVSDATTEAASLMENRQIAILTVQEANEAHPDWEDDDYDGIPFLLYNPASIDAGIRPVGITTARYRFLVHAVPAPMAADTDEPFAVIDYCDPQNPVRRAGTMPSYHRVLAHFVSHELLQRLNDQRWQAYFARYEQMRQEMFSQLQPVIPYLPKFRSPRGYGNRRIGRYV